MPSRWKKKAKGPRRTKRRRKDESPALTGARLVVAVGQIASAALTLWRYLTG